uniref:Thioredoxin domain-containing protein n=1 Tax=Meleagris gallopavo TaxID=9103 RepID=G1MTK2_MELGA
MLAVVDAYQAWCGPCKTVVDLFRRIRNEVSSDLLHFAVAEVDSVDALEKYRGKCEPIFLFYTADCWAEASCMSLNKTSPALWSQPYGAVWAWGLESCAEEKGLGVLVDAELNMSSSVPKRPRRPGVSWVSWLVSEIVQPAGAGGDCSPVLSSGEATHRVRSSVLSPSLQERH